MNLIMAAKKHTLAIEQALRTMLELRVSQLNGCAYCIDLHRHEAQKAGVSRQKLADLPIPQASRLYSNRKKLRCDGPTASSTFQPNRIMRAN